MNLINSSTELPVLEPYYERWQQSSRQLIILPTLHNQVEFSRYASLLIDHYQPDNVLVELPQELETELLTAIDRLPIPTVIHDGQLQTKGDQTQTPSDGHAYVIHPGEAIYWTTFLARRQGIPVKMIDHWHPQAFQTMKVPLDHEHLAAIGWHRFWQESVDLWQQHRNSVVHYQRSLSMGKEVGETKGQTLLLVIGAAHWPIIVRILQQNGWDGQCMIPDSVLAQVSLELRGSDPTNTHNWRLADIHPHTFHLVTSQLPYYLGRFVERPTDFDQLESLRQLYFEAETKYQHRFDERVSPASYTRLFQYLRNLGRLQGQVLPDLFNIIAGAKGMVNDDYAFEVYRTAISYPFLPGEDEKLDEMLKFVPDEEQSEVIRFAFKRRIKRPVLKKMNEDEFDDLDPIPDEDFPGQWQEIWDKYSPYGYVSYPPEDEFIEQYLQYLRKRIIEILMEEESSTLEFETSLEDGIDWRETMRHYHEGKIYVKKYPQNKYTVGSLIVQFLEEPYDSSEYSNHSTLFAEHDQESHISVITTEPGETIIGPGISRVKYAAIISQFPPVGMAYTVPKQNIDLKLRLIWTAMNMSLNKIIGFVAKKPPTAAQRHFAAEHGYRLVYLPMGQLTGSSLRRLRTMHLLAHRGLRDNAREYIGF